MSKPKPKKYTPGFEDVERTFEHLDNEHKKARRVEWLREHYSKDQKTPKTKGEAQ